MEISKVYGIRQIPVADDTVFATPKVARLFDWWHGHAAGGRLPLRRAFDVTEHRDIVADLVLIQVLGGGAFQVRIEGDNVIRLFGYNSTGRVVRSAAAPDGFGHAVAQYYELIVKDGRCRRCLGNLKRVNDRHWIEFESVDCPLSRDGTQVDFILGVMDVIPRTAPGPA